MPEQKVFEKSDLLMVYAGEDIKGERVGEFKVRITRDGLPPFVSEVLHRVYATTVAYFSENLKLLIVSQNVYVTEGSERLPKWHFYRSITDLPKLQIISGLYNSADIHKRLEIEVKAWKHRVELDLPADYPTPDMAIPSFAEKVFNGVREEYRKQGATVDDDGVIHTGGERVSNPVVDAAIREAASDLAAAGVAEIIVGENYEGHENEQTKRKPSKKGKTK